MSKAKEEQQDEEMLQLQQSRTPGKRLQVKIEDKDQKYAERI